MHTRQRLQRLRATSSSPVHDTPLDTFSKTSYAQGLEGYSEAVCSSTIFLLPCRRRTPLGKFFRTNRDRCGCDAAALFDVPIAVPFVPAIRSANVPVLAFMTDVDAFVSTIFVLPSCILIVIEDASFERIAPLTTPALCSSDTSCLHRMRCR